MTGRRVAIISDGRATGGRARSVDLWLPGSDGSMSAYVEAGRESETPRSEYRSPLRIA
jgi:hypothetical protein